MSLCIWWVPFSWILHFPRPGKWNSCISLSFKTVQCHVVIVRIRAILWMESIRSGSKPLWWAKQCVQTIAICYILGRTKYDTSKAISRTMRAINDKWLYVNLLAEDWIMVRFVPTKSSSAMACSFWTRYLLEDCAKHNNFTWTIRRVPCPRVKAHLLKR